MSCVLVVDDELCMREALDALLSPTYCTHTAATGQEALALLRQYAVDAIVLDVILHEEDGLALLDRFQQVSAAPVVVLTAYGTEATMLRAMRGGVRDFFKKPVDCTALCAALARLAPPSVKRHSHVEHAGRYLEAHPMDRKAVGTLARLAGRSERQFRREFVAIYGTTPRRYQLALRLRLAAQLLSATLHSIDEVAATAGFPSLVAFDRHFYAYFHMNPTAYRRQGGAGFLLPPTPPAGGDVQN
jgi:CheY-like chemotaxis protein